jgi:transposase
MRDIDLYRQVLGLEKPWTVERVDLDVAGQRVDIWVEHESGTVWSCPQCGRELTAGTMPRSGSGGIWTPASSDASACAHTAGGLPEHGVVQVRVPWAEARSRFTLLMERLVIDV